MIRKFTLLLSAISFGLGVNAVTLTPEAALARLFSSHRAPALLSEKRFTTSDLIYTGEKNSVATSYIFSAPNKGFIVLSADDNAETVLGYGDKYLTENNIPDNFKWWLEQYSDEISSSRNLSKKSLARPQREDIAPLCEVTWGQTSPFNDDCPTINGVPTLSGCVATAMAQIMKTQNFPSQGKGSNSYSWRGQTLSFDFGSTRFNWEAMNPRYSEDSTDGSEESRKAVAQLMYACGVSVDMQYGIYSSGASATKTASSMIRYFDYGSSTTVLDRSYFSLIDWENYIYRSLAKGAAVLYTGEGTMMAHAFVCDGYKGDGYFHFNWGWNGDCDGFFLLSALNPGIYNDADKGFNKNQKALVNALPANKGGSNALPIFSCTRSITASYDAATSVLTIVGPYKYFGSMTAKCDFAILLTDAEGETKVFQDNSTNLVGYMGEVKQAKATISNIANGVYTIAPAVNHGNGEWIPVSAAPNITNSLIMTVADGEVSFAAPEIEAINLKDFSLNTPLYFNRLFEISFTAENPAESYSELKYAVSLSNESGEVWKSEVATLPMEGLSTETINKQFSLSYPGEDGDYTLSLCRVENDEFATVGIPLEVKALTPPFGFDCEATKIEIANVNNVDPADIQVTAELKMKEGYFCYPIRASIYGNDLEPLLSTTQSDAIFINEGESKEINLNLNFPTLRTGEYTLRLYAAMVNASDDVLPEIGSATFTVGEASVETLSDSSIKIGGNKIFISGEDEGKITLFNLHGIRMAEYVINKDISVISLHFLPEGIYILTLETENGCKTRKVIVR